jgi:catechol 2,3-dioxygenase-like lactoylglutathione lyase family enzyme
MNILRRVALLAALGIATLSSQASAQGTTQVASTPPEHSWWPSSARAQPVALRTRDDQRLASWYIEHLGFKLAGQAGAVRGGGARASTTTVYQNGVVLQLEHAKANPAQTVRIPVADLAGKLRTLEKAGVPILTQGARSAQLRDPEGNLIELVDGSPPRALASN